MLMLCFVLTWMQTTNRLDRQRATAPQVTWGPWPHLNHPLVIFLSVLMRELSFRLSRRLKIATLVLDRTGIPMPSVILFTLVILKAASWSRVGFGPKFLCGFVFNKCVSFLFWITSIFNISCFVFLWVLAFWGLQVLISGDYCLISTA